MWLRSRKSLPCFKAKLIEINAPASLRITYRFFCDRSRVKRRPSSGIWWCWTAKDTLRRFSVLTELLRQIVCCAEKKLKHFNVIWKPQCKRSWPSNEWAFGIDQLSALLRGKVLLKFTSQLEPSSRKTSLFNICFLAKWDYWHSAILRSSCQDCGFKVVWYISVSQVTVGFPLSDCKFKTPWQTMSKLSLESSGLWLARTCMPHTPTPWMTDTQVKSSWIFSTVHWLHAIYISKQDRKSIRGL